MELATTSLALPPAVAERTVLDAILASVGEGVLVETPAGSYLNPRGRELLALPSGDPPALDQIVAIALDGSPLAHEDRPSIRASRAGHPIPFVVRARRFDGVTRTFSGTASPLMEEGEAVGTVVAFRDITEEHSVARVDEQLLQGSFDLLPTAVSVVDLETKVIVDCNDAFSRLTGLTREEMIGRGPPYPWWNEGLASYVDGDVEEATSFDTLFRHADGHPIPVRIVRFEIKEPGCSRGVRVALVTDMSDLRSLEQQLLQSGKLASIGELAAGVAHEINNPLFAIVGLVEFLIRDSEPGSKPHERLVLVQQTAGEIKAIVRALLEFAREPSNEQTTVDLRETLTQTVDLVRRTSANKSIEFVERYPEEPCVVSVNANQVKQVFLNLLSNARAAMPDGGRIEIALTRDASGTLVTVSDSGAGIAADVLPRIFEPFFTTKRDRGGTGLGLSVSHGIVAAHGGSLTAVSEVGAGTTFTMRLPHSKQH